MTVLNMSDLVRDKAPTALESLAKIIPMTAAKIRDALEGPASNIRKSATKNRYKMMVASPLAKRHLFGCRIITWADKTWVAAGLNVFQNFPDCSAWIRVVFKNSNTNLAERFGVKF